MPNWTASGATPSSSNVSSAKPAATERRPLQPISLQEGVNGAVPTDRIFPAGAVVGVGEDDEVAPLELLRPLVGELDRFLRFVAADDDEGGNVEPPQLGIPRT